jgi:SAM-dependent methyltransferase
MFKLPFAPGSFDVVWSEGAIYIIGFSKGLQAWKPLLRPGGYMVASEISWISPNPPAELRGYWESEYPAIAGIDENLDAIHRAGYQVIGHFILPESGWRDDFYLPLQKRIEAMQEKYPGNAEAAEVLDANQQEIHIFNRYSRWYSYVFYIARLPLDQA